MPYTAKTTLNDWHMAFDMSLAAAMGVNLDSQAVWKTQQYVGVFL